MYEHVGIAAVLLILALAGNLGEPPVAPSAPSRDARAALLSGPGM